MPIDGYGSERHFVDHLMPVLRALKRPGDLSGHNPTRPVVVASFGDLKKVRSRGYTKIARMEHGAGQSYGTDHGSYAGGKDHDDVSLFLVPNQHSADRWQARYPDARVEIVGCPKLDTLPRKDPKYPLTVAISFHWDCYLVPETVSAFQHYRFVLPSLRDAVNLIGHAHPRAQAIIERRYRRAHIPLIPDFADVCRQADLYITDNSSSLFEFAATGRPVVVLNQPMYRKDKHFGLRFWDAADVGIQVDRPGDLVDAVELALTDPPAQREARERALDIVYAYRSGAAERAARIIEEWA